MIDILRNVKAVFEKNFADKPEGFQNGFMDCYALFEIAFKKNSQYNLHIKLHETEKELELVSEKLVQERKHWEHVKKSLMSKNEKLEITLQNLMQDAEVDKSQLKYKTRLAIHTVVNTKIEDSRKITVLKKLTAGWDKILP